MDLNELKKFLLGAGEIREFPTERGYAGRWVRTDPNIFQRAHSELRHLFDPGYIRGLTPEAWEHPLVIEERERERERNREKRQAEPVQDVPTNFDDILPTPTPALARNPRFDEFAQQNPKDLDEILSGIRQSTDDDLRRQLLMDIALEESGLRVNPPRNPLSSAKGAFQMINSTANMFGANPLSATESARAANQILDMGKLPWWEILHRGGATRTPLTNLYSEEELSPFIR